MNEGLAWETWNKGLTGNITNEGFRSGNGISRVVSPLQGKPTVDERTTGQGIGMAMLQNALRRVLAASESLCATCVLIHCRDAAAKSFYTHHVDALASPADPLQLVVPMKRIEALLVEQGQDGR